MFAELPLNHLGYSLEYVDIASLGPDSVLGSDVAAVITWFERPPTGMAAFVTWAAAARRDGEDPGGVKFIALGELGVQAAAVETEILASYLARLGIEESGPASRLGLWSRIDASDPAMIGFECDYLVTAGLAPTVRAGLDATSHLRVEFRAGSGMATDLVVTSDRGGYAASEALVRTDDFGFSRWIIDPFAFFERILGTGLRPVPDVTTLNGRRVYFSTIDGDGWTTPAPSASFEDTPVLGGQIVLEQMIQSFPDLPATLALVSGDLDETLGGPLAGRGASLARAAFAQQQIEIASRTRTAPARWSFYSDYRRDEELAIVERLARSRSPEERSLVGGAVSRFGQAFVTGDGAYPGQGDGAPRRYTREPFDLSSEIGGSLAEVGALGPDGTSAAILIWSGDALVFDSALTTVRETRAMAMGGGGGLMDATSPSITGLTPITAPVGAERQIYDALSGDAAFTDFWSRPVYGFLRLARTLEATDTPRRLKPYQLSYSAYSALQFGLRNAVLTNLASVDQEPVIPVHASDYVGMAAGFSGMRITEAGDLLWRIEDREGIQTLRFDDAEEASLDLARSAGVLGARREGETLYVALDPSADSPVLALTGSTEAEAPAAGDVFSLDNSRWKIRGATRTECSVTFAAAGFGRGEMTWQVPRPGSYRIEITESAGADPIFWEVLTAADDRVVSATLPPIATGSVLVALSGC